MVAVQIQDDTRRVIDDDGRLVDGARAPAIPDQELRRLYEAMLLVRVVDDRMMRLQRALRDRRPEISPGLSFGVEHQRAAATIEELELEVFLEQLQGSGQRRGGDV